MNRIAMITGATRGIGAGIALELARQGYTLAVTGTSPEGEKGETMSTLRDMGVKCMYVPMNLGDSAQRRQAVEQVYARFGRLDVLVNNAGMAPRVRLDLLEMKEESLDELLNVNLKGTFLLTQDVARRMLAQPKEGEVPPCIIVVSSISAEVSSISRGEYCISKAGLSMAVKLFADRLAAEGINVYEVQPGIIATDMTSGVKAKYDALIAGGLTPIPRWGQPADIGRAVAALAGGALPYSTGEIIHVDGGMHIQRL
nr:3-ketoacyl-ACP reductase [bacterium]